MKDLPNMAQKELGNPAKPAPVLTPATSAGSTSSSAAASPATPIGTNGNALPLARVDARAEPVPRAKATDGTAGGRDASSSWSQSIWAKWYWGIFIAVALAVSSRLTGSS